MVLRSREPDVRGLPLFLILAAFDKDGDARDAAPSRCEVAPSKTSRVCMGAGVIGWAVEICTGTNRRSLARANGRAPSKVTLLSQSVSRCERARAERVRPRDFAFSVVLNRAASDSANPVADAECQTPETRRWRHSTRLANSRITSAKRLQSCKPRLRSTGVCVGSIASYPRVEALSLCSNVHRRKTQQSLTGCCALHLLSSSLLLQRGDTRLFDWLSRGAARGWSKIATASAEPGEMRREARLIDGLGAPVPFWTLHHPLFALGVRRVRLASMCVLLA